MYYPKVHFNHNLWSKNKKYMIPTAKDVDSRYTISEDIIVLDLGLKTYILS